MGRLAGGFLPVPEDPQPSCFYPTCPAPMCEQRAALRLSPWMCGLRGSRKQFFSFDALVPSEHVAQASSSLVLGNPENSVQRGKWRWDFNSQTRAGDTHSRGFFDLPSLAPKSVPWALTPENNLPQQPRGLPGHKRRQPREGACPTPSTSGQWSRWKDCLVRAVRGGPGDCVWQRGHWSGISPPHSAVTPA